MSTGLILEDVSKTFVEKKAVKGISFSLNKPGVFGLLGTNGAGKTTSRERGKATAQCGT